MTDALAPLITLMRQLREPDPPTGVPSFCQRCQEELPLFVSDEVAGRPVDDLYPEIAYHLDLCENCLVEYGELAHLTSSALFREGNE